jgi:hypothetical protein
MEVIQRFKMLSLLKNPKTSWPIGLLVLLGSSTAVNPQSMAPSLNMYGTTGLIDMPSAESQVDAELSTTLAGFAGGTRGTFTFQILPRLSGSFRYAKTPFLDEGKALYDRSFDIQYRLVDEQKYVPAVAVGLRDFLGTGIYSGQYLVATKNLSPKLKLTGGIGWGRFSDSDEIQDIDFGQGGTVDFDNMFKGPVGAFGGLEWQTPVKGLRAKLEYSSDRYARETTVDGSFPEAAFERKSPVNFGLEYAARNGLKFGAYYLYGSEIGLSFSTTLNPKRNNGLTDRAPRRVAIRKNVNSRDTSWTQANGINAKARLQLNKLLKTDGMVVETISFDGQTADVRVRNTKYKAVPQAIGRTARAMTRVFPDSVQTFRIIPVEDGISTSMITMQRSDIEALEHHPNGTALMAQRVSIDDAPPVPSGSEYNPDLYPKLKWSVSPYVNLIVFDSRNPLNVDAGLRASASYDVQPGLSFSGSLKLPVIGDRTADDRQDESNLHPVRTDIKKYREEGDLAIERLTGDYVFKLRPDVYGRVSVGYLETMFAGVSTEVLWKKADKNWGLGAEMNYVKQREFSQGFGFQDYSVATGHVSAYLTLPKGFEAQIDVGRYLAGDVGATVSIDRTFGNGWRVGAYASKTNVSAEDFGEGSFDKGIRIDIPLTWALGTPSKKTVSNSIASLTRDGGARLNIHNRLYDTVRDNHSKSISGAWGRFWR